MSNNIFTLIPSTRHDLASSVKSLCTAFHVPAHAEQQLTDCLAHLEAKRFSLPYAEGAPLAAKRPFGIELRAIVASPSLDAKLLYSLDHVTCDEAGMLELFDRLGAFGAFTVIADAARGVTPSMSAANMATRVAPLAPEHALPIMREALASFLNDTTGMKASKREDFKRAKGEVSVVPGRMADFIQQALQLVGWDFSAKELAENYKVVLMKRQWIRHPRPRPRPRRGT